MDNCNGNVHLVGMPWCPAPEADIKTFPSPAPTTERTDDYIEERVFGNFQNFWEPRFKMLEPGFWVFSPPSGKGVNTRTDNLRVHTASSNTRTTSVRTTAYSGWLEWRSHECPKVTGTTSNTKIPSLRPQTNTYALRWDQKTFIIPKLLAFLSLQCHLHLIIK